MLYARRYEEGYDLHDAKYETWLAVNHPEAISSRENDVVPSCSPTEPSVDHCHSVISTPEAPLICSPSNVTPNSSLERSTKRSPFSDLLNSPEVLVTPPKPKSAKARVLTSIECMRILKEKQDKKQKEAEEKENRKKERAEKKKLKEDEKKRKAEEKAKATQHKATGKGKSTAKATKAPIKRKGDTAVRSSRKSRKIDLNESIESDVCCVCFGNYNDDLDTTREWLQCKCDRWIHEDCIDDEDCVITEGKLCPLC